MEKRTLLYNNCIIHTVSCYYTLNFNLNTNKKEKKMSYLLRFDSSLNLISEKKMSCTSGDTSLQRSGPTFHMYRYTKFGENITGIGIQRSRNTSQV